MKTEPIAAAAPDFSDPEAIHSPAFGDIYATRSGAWAQAEHVFLRGNDLPRRWQNRRRFVILETGFGLGSNFLATWHAWRHSANRCERLTFISIEKHPLTGADMARALARTPAQGQDLVQALLAAWPPLTPNLHALSFENGQVELLLALGDVRAWAAELVASVDAYYLDGFAPARNPVMWDAHVLRTLSRLAAPGATAATWSTARALRDGLSAAGFTVNTAPGLPPKLEMTVAQHTPRHTPTRPAGRLAIAPNASHAIVVGGGLAGASAAWALSSQGVACTVLDALPAPAQGTSGNPRGLLHGTFNPFDGLHARFNRSAALHAQRVIAPWAAQNPELADLTGLVRLEHKLDLAAMQAQLAAQGLPPGYLTALGPHEASARLGLTVSQPAWFYPTGGWASASLLVPTLLQACGPALRWVGGTAVHQLRRQGDQWEVLDAHGQVLGRAPLVVLAQAPYPQAGSLAAPSALQLLQRLQPDLAADTQQIRGQITHWPGAPDPHIPLAGQGYALHGPLQAGDTSSPIGLWCGATHQEGDLDGRVRTSDHALNLSQWQALSNLAFDVDAAANVCQGRTGWRISTPDRLPLAGTVLNHAALNTVRHRLDQCRTLPRLPGLAVHTALGSRGLTWCLLSAQVMARQALGEPQWLESSLIDAIDPMRHLARRARQASPSEGEAE